MVTFQQDCVYMCTVYIPVKIICQLLKPHVKETFLMNNKIFLLEKICIRSIIILLTQDIFCEQEIIKYYPRKEV